jgi:hypothetical protein
MVEKIFIKSIVITKQVENLTIELKFWAGGDDFYG